MDINVTEVVGDFWMLEGLVVLCYKITILVILIENLCIRYIVISTVDSDSWWCGEWDYFLETVFAAYMLCA